MSVEVIGKGVISFETFVGGAFVESIVKKMKGMVSFCDVIQAEESIFFDMSGKNGIIYDQLNEIKEELLKYKLQFSIRVSEYSECEGGYLFDSEED